MIEPPDSVDVIALVVLVVLPVAVGSVAVGSVGVASATGAESSTADVGPPVEYEDPVHGPGTIELPVGDAVETAVEAADVQVWVNGDEVTDDEGRIRGSVTVHEAVGNRIVVSTSLGDLLPVQEVVINVTGSRGRTDSDLSFGNRTVRVTGATLDLAGGARRLVRGTDVAVVTASAGTVVEFGRNGGGPSRSRGTGPHSRVLAFDTAGDSLASTYWVRSGANNVTYDLYELGLTGQVSATRIDEGRTVTVTATMSVIGRSVEFRLVDDDGTVAYRARRELGADGTASASFTVGAPGRYRVVVVDPRTGVRVEVGELLVRDVPSGGVALDDPVVVDQRGDVVDIPLTFEGEADGGTVVVGSEKLNFEVRITVTDDWDGSATLHWNTYEAANATGGFYVTGAADVTIDVEVAAAGPIAPVSYPVVAEFEGRTTSVGTVVVERRAIDGVAIFTAPAAAGTATGPDLREVFTRDDTVALDEALGRADWVVVRVRASGLEGYVDGARDLNHTAGLRTVVVEAPSTVKPNERRVRVPVSRMRYFEGDEDTYYLAFRPTAVPGVTAGDRFIVRFTVGEASPVTPGTQSVATSFTVVPGRVSVDVRGETLLLSPGARAVVTGTSTFASGTDLTVQLVGLRIPDRLSASRRTVVRRDGTWVTSFDFSKVRAGQDFEIVVRKAGRARARVAGRAGERTASVSFDAQTATDAGTLVTVDAATLEVGGFVVVHEGGPAGEVVGVSDYLEPGRTYGDVEIRLEEAVTNETTLVAVAHLDADGDRVFDHRVEDDEPYLDDGRPVADRARVSPPTPTASPTPGSSPSTTSTASPTPTPGSTTSTTPTSTAPPARTATDERTERGTATPSVTATGATTGDPSATAASTPGPGVVAAVAALLAAVLLSGRRD